jgi:signal transduction histidine kinase
VLLPAREYATPQRDSPGYLVGEWKLGAEDGYPGELETVVNISELLKVAAPGMGSQFSLIERDIPDPSGSLDSADSLVVCIPVRDEGWPSPVHWTLVCKQHPSGLLQSVTALAGRYRTTVILNMIIMSVALVLGVVTFQQVRRTAALEAENQQQARVRELERQVLHNERLASVGRLASGMAHEINNPLEGMTNYLGLLEDDMQSQSAAGSLELVTRVREGLDRVAGIIGQVLVFSDPGYSPLLPLDLKDALNETVSFVRTNPSFRRTAVVLNTCPEDVSVLGNRVTLGQLFLNLLMNASQLQPEGGQIEVGLVRERKHAIVLVADCGPGIPADVLPRIFEPFYSTRGSTGLGLSVCHGIVTEHRGRIWAENRPEGGAIFFIQFPLYTGETAESEAGSGSTVAGFSTHGGVRT